MSIIGSNYHVQEINHYFNVSGEKISIVLRESFQFNSLKEYTNSSISCFDHIIKCNDIEESLLHLYVLYLADDVFFKQDIKKFIYDTQEMIDGKPCF